MPPQFLSIFSTSSHLLYPLPLAITPLLVLLLLLLLLPLPLWKQRIQLLLLLQPSCLLMIEENLHKKGRLRMVEVSIITLGRVSVVGFYDFHL